MSRDTVQSWDPVADNNSDIAGINIAELCPAAGVNNALRTIMGQVAVWITSATGPILKVAGSIANAVTVTDGYGAARTIGYRGIPSVPKTAAYVLALTDVGGCIDITTGGVTVPLNATVAFTVGDAISIYNASASNQIITAASGVTLRLVGTTTTGNRTLAGYGWATLRKVGTDEWVAAGGGVT